MSYNSIWTGPQIDDAVGKALASAKQTDLTSIIATGSKNATGSTIASGTYFYLNGTLVRAKANIASGAKFTSSNYEAVTAGGLNALKAAFDISNIMLAKSVPVAMGKSLTLSVANLYGIAGLLVCINGPRTTLNGLYAVNIYNNDPSYNQAAAAVTASDIRVAIGNGTVTFTNNNQSSMYAYISILLVNAVNDPAISFSVN